MTERQRIKFDPRNAFGNEELIHRMKRRNKNGKKGVRLCDYCDNAIKDCICYPKSR